MKKCGFEHANIDWVKAMFLGRVKNLRRKIWRGKAGGRQHLLEKQKWWRDVCGYRSFKQQLFGSQNS